MRAIDVDALIEKCGDWYVEEGTESGFIGTLKSLLVTQPTITPEPHWIPVTERLPETGQDVELCCGYKNYRGEIVRYICIAYHVNRYEMKSSADWDEGCDEYREEDDEYYVLEGWYERIHNWDTYGAVNIDDLALAWRELAKLPEPFKGVTE